jgi:hypothetical protein
MTIRTVLGFLIGIGLSGAIRDYYGGRSLDAIMIADLSFVAVGLIGLGMMWWKDKRAK